MFGVSTTSLVWQKRNRSNWNMVSNSLHWKTESIFSLVIYNFLSTDLLVTYFHEFWIYESTNPRIFFTKNVLFSFAAFAEFVKTCHKHVIGHFHYLSIIIIVFFSFSDFLIKDLDFDRDWPWCVNYLWLSKYFFRNTYKLAMLF